MEDGAFNTKDETSAAPGTIIFLEEDKGVETIKEVHPEDPAPSSFTYKAGSSSDLKYKLPITEEIEPSGLPLPQVKSISSEPNFKGTKNCLSDLIS